jgi:hypothetical protein
MASAWCNRLYAAFYEDGAPTKATGKRKVRLWLRSKRQRDYANAFLAADKLILDQLKRHGWLVDDSPKWLELEVNPEVGDPQTIIEIIELDGQGNQTPTSPAHPGGGRS